MSTSSGTSVERPLLFVIFFFSGFAALVYQVLWVRELGLLFGSTAQAAALSIAIFFTGLATGGWFWGRRAGRMKSSLRGFGLLEIGVAVTALGHFVLVDAYRAVYPAVYALVGHSPVLDTLMKAAIAATILLPPSFLMGGTLPLMGQHLVRARERLAAMGSLLYAVNTAGSATGAFAAGFFLPLALGFRRAYLLAVCIDVAVGIVALLLARRSVERPLADPAPPPAPLPAAEPQHLPLPPSLIWLAAFVSGFATLGVEVAWTRLFAQVLQNSVYTYSLVLTCFLLALTLGAALAGVLARLERLKPGPTLLLLLLLSAGVIAASPWLFNHATDGLRYVGSQYGWQNYILSVGMTAVTVLLLPVAILGTVLPYLLRILQHELRAPGEIIGRLVATNTTGAILGSLFTGFVLLPTVGAYRSLLLLAALYPLLVLVLLRRLPLPGRPALAGALAVAVALLVFVPPTGLQNIRLRSVTEHIVDIREGTQATVAVIASDDSLRIRVNNYYTLGGTRGRDSERNQTVIPMLLHREPKEVFYLGMGTGLTAGAALSFPVDRVVVSELIGDVVKVAEAHFGPWINGLFEDRRVTVYADDGRNCLSRSRDRYDVIISDLFTPWKAGTGNLYTLEHYRTVRDRLLPGGLFAQWIPLYQVSEQEFGIIARTMTEAFPQVVLWRGDLFSNRSIVALVGHGEETALDPGAIALQGRRVAPELDREDAWYEALVLRYYGGNITEGGLFEDYPVNTDDYPLIEYLAPRTHRLAQTGEARFLNGAAREDLYARVRNAVPVDEDPYLSLLDDTQRAYVRAGDHYSRYRFLYGERKRDEALKDFAVFRRLSPPDSIRDISPARVFGHAFEQDPEDGDQDDASSEEASSGEASASASASGTVGALTRTMVPRNTRNASATPG